MTQEQIQGARVLTPARVVFERMIEATNRHDLEALVASFAPDYRSEQPFHPELNFVGRDGVRRNWSRFFTTMPDIHIEILGAVADGDTVWAELHYQATQGDGSPYSMRGAMICGIEAGQISWARLYIDPKQ